MFLLCRIYIPDKKPDLDSLKLKVVSGSIEIDMDVPSWVYIVCMKMYITAYFKVRKPTQNDIDDSQRWKNLLKVSL